MAARGWSASRAAEALEPNPHMIGEWLPKFHLPCPAAFTDE